MNPCKRGMKVACLSGRQRIQRHFVAADTRTEHECEEQHKLPVYPRVSVRDLSSSAETLFAASRMRKVEITLVELLALEKKNVVRKLVDEIKRFTPSEPHESGLFALRVALVKFEVTL